MPETMPETRPETRPAIEMQRDAGPMMGRIVDNRRLRHNQHAHAAIVAIAGLAGVIGAVVLAFRRPISTVSIGCFLGFFLPIGFGVTGGFHRLFTHRSFTATPAVRGVIAALGCMAGQGPVVFWVSLHRLHHELADHEGDPHSPHLHGKSRWQRFRGLLHAYAGWTVRHPVPNPNRYARDLFADPVVMAINRRYHLWLLLGLLLPAAVGGLVTSSWLGALEGFLWGGLVRMFALHNAIWWITSFAHVFGTRDFASRDRSTNNLWIALPTLGEGWHNNHHAFPTAAILRFEWWQLDITGGMIRLLELVGLVRDVQRPTARMLAARRESHGIAVTRETHG